MRAKSWLPDESKGLIGRSNDPFEVAARAFEQATIPVVEFYDDPVGFVNEFVDFGTPKGGDKAGLTSYQDELMAELPRRMRISARGPHGLGKTTTNALTVIWFAVTRDAAGRDWKIATTAGAWRQLEKYLWPEIHKWARKLRWDKLGIEPWREGQELMSLSMKLDHGEAFAVASSDKQKIEGVHADSVLYIFDESKAIAADIFDAAEGAFSGTVSPEQYRTYIEAKTPPDERGLEAFAVATSTPGEPSGRFYDIHSRKPGFQDWWVRHVRLDEVMAAGRISEHWRTNREEQWGRDSALYANRVLGEFHSSADDAAIPLSWVEAAVERWHAWRDAGRRKGATTCVYGVDVARGGKDYTAIARRRGDVIEKIDKLNLADTTKVAAAVQVRLTGGDEAVVDVLGVGAGVFDQLRSEGRNVRPFTASKRSRRKDRSGQFGFLNRRAELWWAMRERLDPAFNPTVCLPPDEDLLAELVAPRWSVTAAGKIQIESKEDIKERIGRSTDTADAVLQTWASPESVDEFSLNTPGQAAEQVHSWDRVDDLANFMPGATGEGGAVSFGSGESDSYHPWKGN